MAAGPRRGGTPDDGGFGKRGNVRLTPQIQATQAAHATAAAKEPAGGFGGAFSSIPNPMKWAGGGLAVLALVGMLGGAGLGSGGFLGGLLGGMLASRLMQNKAPAAAPHAGAPTTAAAHNGGSAASTQAVTRGGFGATAGAHGGGSSGG
jgi:hypothetical protein